MQQLPATILDAIALTRSLLIPYLWVDSLCIIQDLEEDKIREIATMAQVYKITLVILCNEGLRSDSGSPASSIAHPENNRSA